VNPSAYRKNEDKLSIPILKDFALLCSNPLSADFFYIRNIIGHMTLQSEAAYARKQLGGDRHDYT